MNPKIPALLKNRTFLFVLVFIGVAAVAVFNYWLLQNRIETNRHDAAISNLSGRQRMLLVKIALLSYRLIEAKQPDELLRVRNELSTAINLMATSHLKLLHGDPESDFPGFTSESVRAIFYDLVNPLDIQIRHYIAEARALAQSPPSQLHTENPHFQYLQTGEVDQQVLGMLDAVVSRHQKDNEIWITQLEGMQLMILLIYIASILIACILVLRLQNRIQQEEERHQKHLENQVAERTGELSQAQLRLSTILEIAGDAIISINQEQKIILYNQEAENIFGYTAAEVLGGPLERLMPERYRAVHPRHIHEFEKGPRLSRRMGERGEIRGVRKNGQEFFAEASISHVNIDGAPLFTVVLRDISIRKRMEQELYAAKVKAEDANQAKTRFLTNMSHEIRTPLNSIVGFSQILIRQCEKLDVPDAFRQYLQNMQIAGKNLSELINNILELSKIEAGKMSVTLETINLQLLVQGIYHINKVQAHSKEIDFQYFLGPDLPEFIEGDRTKLNQILMNLVGNAVKFTPPRKAIRFQCLKEEDYLLFKIIDQGIGIPPERHQAIFENFEQGDALIARRYGGSGLGLSITKKMVEMLGGRIELESIPGHGSTFVFYCPLRESAPVAPLDAGSRDWSQLEFMEDNRVLVIEDDVMSLEMMKGFFLELGLSIELAGNGQTGLWKLSDFGPNLVILDMHLPDMDGIEITQKIRIQQEWADLPIIALSADAFIEQQNRALEAGVTDYLVKPLDTQKMMPLLARYLKTRPRSAVVEKTAPPRARAETEQQWREALDQLEQTPLYLSDEIIRQVRQLRQMCPPDRSEHLNVLRQMEEAVFSRASKKLPALIQKIRSL